MWPLSLKRYLWRSSKKGAKPGPSGKAAARSGGSRTPREAAAVRTFGLYVLNASIAAALREPRHRVFALPVKVRNELLCVAWLGPDLRSLTAAASLPSTPHRLLAGSVLTSLVSAVAELWGHCEQRGFHTRLEGARAGLATSHSAAWQAAGGGSKG